MGWVFSVTPWPLYPRERDQIPIVQEDGWAPGPVWTGGENLAPTAIRSQDRSACSQSLHHLLHRVSQEERTKLREGVPYVKLYRYNPKHLYPKLNGYGDNGKWSLKFWQLLQTYWLPNSYWNWQEYVVSVMLIPVLNIKVTCEWHKAIKLNYKNTRTTVAFALGFQVIDAGSSRALSRQRHYIPMLASGFSLPGMRSGWVWRHGRHAVRGHPRNPNFSMAIISVTIQLWI